MESGRWSVSDRGSQDQPERRTAKSERRFGREGRNINNVRKQPVPQLATVLPNIEVE